MRTDPSKDPPPARAIDTYVVNEDAELLLLRRSFSQRPAPGVFTTSLHGHPGPREDPVETARHLALTTLGLRLQDVVVVVSRARLRSPGCPLGGPEAGTILLARASRRVVTPDPTRYDDADWVRWDADLLDDAASGVAHVPPVVLSAVGALSRPSR